MRRGFAVLQVEAQLGQVSGLVSEQLQRADLFSPEEIDLQMKIRKHLGEAKEAARLLSNSVWNHCKSVDLHELVDWCEERNKPSAGNLTVAASREIPR